MALASSTVRQRRTFQPAKIFAAGKEQTTNRNELERIELEEKKAKDKENAERRSRTLRKDIKIQQLRL